MTPDFSPLSTRADYRQFDLSGDHYACGHAMGRSTELRLIPRWRGTPSGVLCGRGVSRHHARARRPGCPDHDEPLSAPGRGTLPGPAQEQQLPPTGRTAAGAVAGRAREALGVGADSAGRPCRPDVQPRSPPVNPLVNGCRSGEAACRLRNGAAMSNPVCRICVAGER